jgi:Arc/MetJ family transcription regulator
VYGLHIARTNIDINERLIRRVMRRYGLTTKRAAVDLALRRLDLEPMSVDEALSLRGTGWEGDLAELRDAYLGPTP